MRTLFPNVRRVRAALEKIPMVTSTAPTPVPTLEQLGDQYAASKRIVKYAEKNGRDLPADLRRMTLAALFDVLSPDKTAASAGSST